RLLSRRAAQTATSERDAPFATSTGSARKEGKLCRVEGSRNNAQKGPRVTTATEHHTGHTLEVAGLGLRYLKGGAGAPVVVLHHSTGNPGWIPFYERLAERATVYVPDMPGYGQSARPEWAREPRDLGILLLQALTRLHIERVALVGLGLGGFVG